MSRRNRSAILDIIARGPVAASELARSLAIGSSWPLFMVDALGGVCEVGTLRAISPEHFFIHSARACASRWAAHYGQLIDRPFEPTGADAATLSVWPRARDLALNYWQRLCEEPRLSEDFRKRCRSCRDAVRRLSQRGAQSRIILGA
jgi:hypothetical protein